MYKPSKKTIYLTGAFAAVAGLVGVYSYWNDISYAVCDKVYPEANEGEVRLKDSQGNRYSLLNHGDGKETALYDDNRSVTFHRDNGGNFSVGCWFGKFVTNYCNWVLYVSWF